MAYDEVHIFKMYNLVFTQTHTHTHTFICTQESITVTEIMTLSVSTKFTWASSLPPNHSTCSRHSGISVSVLVDQFVVSIIVYKCDPTVHTLFCLPFHLALLFQVTHVAACIMSSFHLLLRPRPFSRPSAIYLWFTC